MNIVSVTTPTSVIKRTEYESYAHAKKAYDEHKGTRTPGTTSLVWHRDGKIFRRYRLDEDYEGEREVKFPRYRGRAPKYGEQTRRVSLRIPVTLCRKIEQEAEREGMEFSEVAVQRMRKGIMKTEP